MARSTTFLLVLLLALTAGAPLIWGKHAEKELSAIRAEAESIYVGRAKDALVALQDKLKRHGRLIDEKNETTWSGNDLFDAPWQFTALASAIKEDSPAFYRRLLHEETRWVHASHYFIGHIRMTKDLDQARKLLKVMKSLKPSTELKELRQIEPADILPARNLRCLYLRGEAISPDTTYRGIFPVYDTRFGFPDLGNGQTILPYWVTGDDWSVKGWQVVRINPDDFLTESPRPSVGKGVPVPETSYPCVNQ